MTTPPPLLETRGFGVAFGSRVILAEVDLQVPPSGVTVLMGPVGVGKSTLLRTICGLNDASPQMHTWGEVHFAGQLIGDTRRPQLVEQKASVIGLSVRRALTEAVPDRDRLTQAEQLDHVRAVLAAYGVERLLADPERQVLDLPQAEQRQVLIVRHLLHDADLICIDEPTTNLTDEDAEGVLDLVQRIGEQQPLLVVTHNQKRARRIGSTTALLAGGRIIEQADTRTFFGSPADPITQSFVRSGSCSVPSPGTDPRYLDPETPPPTPLPESARLVGVTLPDPEPEPEPDPEPEPHAVEPPAGFHWIQPRLAGCPVPGLMGNLWTDMEALRSLGTSVLVSLTEAPFEPTVLSAFGIRGHHEPIDDMHPPALPRADCLARMIEEWLDSGETVVVHCRAGLGRTGTVLACQLIYQGMSAATALARVRAIQPLYIQSQSQQSFLDIFASWCRRAYPEPPGAARGSPEPLTQRSELD